MKRRLLATVLTLAMLCPMLAYFATFGTFAALEVDDGVPVSASNIINEEWNFDDMTSGETLTDGYISSHARGEFTYARKATDGLLQPEKWTAVVDPESGRSYIYAENAYMAFNDVSKLLLTNTYEVSWDMKVDAIGSSTTLLWWSATEAATDRNCLLRYNSNGALGYTTDNSYQSAVTVSATATLGKWHSYRARISPTDGRVWLWFDGRLIINGAVNSYLRDNAAEAEVSNIGIFFAWGGSGMKASLDNIKITSVSIDEHLEFNGANAAAPVDVTWDFNDGKFADKDGVIITSGTNYDIGIVEGDTVNTTKALRVMKKTEKGEVNGPRFTLPGKISDYSTITISYKMKYNYGSNLVNGVRLVDKNGGYTNLFRIHPMADSSSATASVRYLSDTGTEVGSIKNGEWTTFTITIKPVLNQITTKLTTDSGTVEKALNGNSTLKTIFDGLAESGSAFSFMLYRHAGMSAEVMFDDVSISATPTKCGGDELLDFEEFTVGDSLTASAMGSGFEDGFVTLDFERSGAVVSATDPDNTANKVVYITDRKLRFDFTQKLSSYGKLHLAFDVKFENMGGYTSFMAVNDTNADSTNDKLIRINNASAAIGYSSDGSGDIFGSHTLTQGTGAKWYTFDFNITPSTGGVAFKVTERDTGTVVVNLTFTSAPIKAVYNNGENLTIWLHHCWGSNFKMYLDNFEIEAMAPIEEIVDSEWIDPTFEMSVTPDVANMANDDWTIAADPKLSAPFGVWNFNDGKVASQNGIAVSSSSSVEYKAVSGDTVNTTKAIATKIAKDSSGNVTKNTVSSPKYTLPGIINDYEKITVSYKVRYGSGTRSSNTTNLFRFDNATSGQSVLLRVPSFKTVNTVTVSYRDGSVNSSGGANSASSGITIGLDTWNTISYEITPATGAVVLTINGKTKSFTNSKIKEIYDQRADFAFWLYYHVDMYAEVYIDDVSITTEYSKEHFDALGYSENKVLKTVTDSEGNTRGIFVIKDKEKLLTKQPFELSFDYMMNQKPLSGDWLNLVKFKMNGTAFSIFRLAPDGTLYNYTSEGYKKFNGISGSSGDNRPLNVASKKIVSGTWYNFRIAFDPLSGHIMGYIDNILVCDYNINDVYINENGTPIGVTENPTQMYIELASQYSASDIPINDSCFDNVRIRTLNYNEFKKTVLSDVDFDSTAKGALTAEGFAKATGLYSKTLNGNFVVTGTDVAKYVDAEVKAGEGVAIDMTNVYAPFAAKNVSLEGNFTFTAFGSSGKLNIYSLKRDQNDAASLLSVDNSGKLFVGTKDTGCVLSLGTTYNVRLVFSGIGGTAELYVNDCFVTASEVIPQSELPVLKYTDSMGNEVSIGNKKFLVSESATVKTLSGVKLQRTEMPDPFKTKFPEDTLNFLFAEGSGAWNVKFDELCFTVDNSAYVYSDVNADSYEFADINGSLWGNSFIAQFTYDSDSSEIVSLADWTLGNTPVSLAKVGNGKLYASDGTTALADIDSKSDIALSIKSNYWETPVAADNYSIDVIAYVDGEVVGSYNAAKTSATSSGKLVFADGVSDVKVYFGTAIRNNRVSPDASGVKFDGYTAFSVDFEDENFFDTAEKNAINYVEWAFSDIGKTITDMDGSTVTLSEYVEEDGNSFFRIRRPENTSKPSAYMEYNLSAMGEYAELYSVELDMRFVDKIASSMCIARLYRENMSGELDLLLVDYENRFYFISNGIRYYLCDSAGNGLVCNKPSADSFTEVAFVINEADGYYSIWIDGTNAYYYGDGQHSGKVTRAGEIPLDYTPNESYTLCAPKIRLFEGSNNAISDSVADVDNISIDIIKNGMAPLNYNYQINEIGDAVRFVATVDTLYTNSVGFEIVASSNLETSKSYSDSGNIVFSSVIAGKDGDGNNIVITADELGGRYISVFSITDLPTAEYIFKVKPFVELFGKKIYGQETVYTFPE